MYSSSIRRIRRSNNGITQTRWTQVSNLSFSYERNLTVIVLLIFLCYTGWWWRCFKVFFRWTESGPKRLMPIWFRSFSLYRFGITGINPSNQQTVGLVWKIHRNISRLRHSSPFIVVNIEIQPSPVYVPLVPDHTTHTIIWPTAEG